MAIKIAVSNAKGGVGKSTTAICIAQELRRKYPQKQTLIIDTDPQCNTTKFYRAEIGRGIASMEDILCELNMDAAEAIQHCEYGDIIPCEPSLKDAENTIKADDYRSVHLKRAGKSINQMYDYIIVDTPPAEGVILRNVLAFVDYLVIPVQESGWSFDGLVAFYEDSITGAIEMTNPGLKIAGILIVMSRSRTRISKTIKEASVPVANKLGTKVFNTTIRESSDVPQALTNYGIPLYELPNKNRCLVQMDYEAFVDELVATVAGKDK